MIDGDFEKTLSRRLRGSEPPKRAMRRSVRVWAALPAMAIVLVGALMIGSALSGWHAQTNGAAATGSSQASASPCSMGSPSGEPPRAKPTPDNLSGAVDLPYEFETGAIRVRIAPCRSIDDLLKKYGPPGPASHWNTPPFTALDVQYGLDRSYRISVPVGTEKQWVVRLAPHVEDFDWVQMIWKFPMGT